MFHFQHQFMGPQLSSEDFGLSATGSLSLGLLKVLPVHRTGDTEELVPVCFLRTLCNGISRRSHTWCMSGC